MSWGFGGLASAVPGGGAQANAAPDLEAIETELLGFQALGGARKVRLLPQPWQVDTLPSKTASLLSVASGRGLVAAAGPDSLVLYDADSIRFAFSREGAGDVEDLQSRQRASIPRISHLSFASNEQALVITAENGGGLAIYDVNAATSNSQWTPGIQIATSGVSVRHLLPNPNKEFAHLFAVVLNDGKLVIADLKSESLTTGANGNSVLKENVSCASWSKMGKQIVAGLADGTAVQLDVQGNQKEQIPRPPNTDESLPVSAIYWLENMDFLLIHTPVTAQGDADSMMAADALYHLVHRDKETKACSFHRFSVDPCPPFLDERLPAHHFVQRIRDWQPNLDDSLIVACTASTDIGVLTRSKTPLSPSLPQEKITHTYTTTSFPDTRRAALPMSTDGMTDTFPIGVALDLSSKQKVTKPIPNDETIDESSTALPQYCILNQEGYLSAWWFVYNEGVRTNNASPGLASAANSQAPSQQPAQPASSAVGSASRFGAQPAITTRAKPTFGQSSTPAFGQPSTPAFAQPSTPAAAPSSTPAFGQPSTPAFTQPSAPAFGMPAFGQAASPWGASTGTSTFGKPSFGAPSQIGISTGSAFGQSGGLGTNKPSVWGSSTTGAPAGGSTLGQTSAFGGNTSTQSPFASFSKLAQDDQSKPAVSPFAAFGQNKTAASPFAAFNTQKDKLSPFAATGKPGMPNETSFGSTVTLSSNNTTSFGSGAPLGGASPFGKAADTKEETMGDVETPREEKRESAALSGFKLGSTFKPDDSSKDEPASGKDVSSSLFGFGFDKALGDAEKETLAASPLIKEEANDTSGPFLKDIPEAPVSKQPAPAKEPEAAPLPPDFITTKSINTTAHKAAEDAPLPPDFVSSKSKPSSSATNDPLPPDFLASKANPSIRPTTSAEQQTSLPNDDEEDSLEDDDENESGGPGEDNDDEADWDDEDEDGAEGDKDDDEVDDEVDDDDEDEEDEHTPIIANPKRLSAFEARITPASPKKTQHSEQSTTPETVQKPTFTPAGFPKAPLTFAPTRKVDESPRSPSPVRAVTSPVRFNQQNTPAAAVKISSVPSFQPKSTARSSLFKEPPPQPSQEELEDEEDQRIKQILEAPTEPSQTLPEFIAHQDYTGESHKEGIAGQLEKVYRDVNSMIDTLGLNARALKAFIAGHENANQSRQLNEDDLDNADAWRIGELSALESLQTKIGDRLDSGRITEVSEKIQEIMEQDEQTSRIRAKTTELRKQITSRTDPEKKAQQQAAPLPQAWATQQIELRSSLRNVQKLLTQVEDNVGLLRADLATAAAESGETNPTTGVPTVEAVTNTILKMTAMIEKKSGDIDVLEAQIRQVPEGVAPLGMSGGYEDDLAASLAMSRISNGNGAHSTPPRKTRAGNPLGMSGMLGSQFRTPPSASLRTSTVFNPSASAFGRSTTSVGSARKKMSDVTTEEIESYKDKATRRRKVLAALRLAVEGAGKPKTVQVSQV